MSSYRYNVCVEGVEVNQQIDAGISKSVHATVMVGTCIDVIDAQGVCAELLHELDIALALLCVDKRVIRAKLVSNTCRMLVE